MSGRRDVEHDPQLWVRLSPAWAADTEVRWVIAGNAHTHRGHFSVYVPGTDLGATINLGDIVEMSAPARRWVQGFLAGQEADRSEFFGGCDELFDDPDAMARWRDWNARFGERGFMPRLQLLPPPAPQLSELGAPTPWAHVGGRYRVWDGSAWMLADPQPSDVLEDSWAWPGSVCERRRHCSLTERGRLTVCEDCHHVQPS